MINITDHESLKAWPFVEAKKIRIRANYND